MCKKWQATLHTLEALGTKSAKYSVRKKVREIIYDIRPIPESPRKVSNCRSYVCAYIEIVLMAWFWTWYTYVKYGFLRLTIFVQFQKNRFYFLILGLSFLNLSKSGWSESLAVKTTHFTYLHMIYWNSEEDGYSC